MEFLLKVTRYCSVTNNILNYH